jgi:DNA-directed RNA polymerase specialized sigma24 family protein
MTQRRRRRLKAQTLRLRTDMQREWIARYVVLGWSAEKMARKLHCTSRRVRYTTSTPALQTLVAQLRRETFERIDHQVPAPL